MFPRLSIDLERIRANAERMMAICAGRGVDVMGVTKGVGGNLAIAKVLVDSGVTSLGDARLDNLAGLRDANLDVPLWLLRSPSPREATACAAVADGSLHSELETVARVAEEARRRSTIHHILLMVDLDTGREGLDPDDVPAVCAEIEALEGLVLDGLGTYFDLESTSAQQRDALSSLVALDAPVRIRSGGASNVLELVVDGTLPHDINHLRLGTAPLLGLYTSHGPRPIEGWERDTFVAEAEVIEVKRHRREAILALGYVDAPMEQLYPTTPGMRLLRQSSDHTVVGFNEPLTLGDTVRFRLGYSAMSRLACSRYTNIEYRARAAAP